MNYELYASEVAAMFAGLDVDVFHNVVDYRVIRVWDHPTIERVSIPTQSASDKTMTVAFKCAESRDSVCAGYDFDEGIKTPDSRFVHHMDLRFMKIFLGEVI